MVVLNYCLVHAGFYLGISLLGGKLSLGESGDIPFPVHVCKIILTTVPFRGDKIFPACENFTPNFNPQEYLLFCEIFKSLPRKTTEIEHSFHNSALQTRNLALTTSCHSPLRPLCMSILLGIILFV
jgi:hypothetical protein